MVKMRPELSIYLNAAGCLIVKLNKALYGLVVASQLWYKSLSVALMSFGLKRSSIDKCVFYGELDGHRIFMCVHVDDIGIFKHDGVAG